MRQDQIETDWEDEQIDRLDRARSEEKTLQDLIRFKQKELVCLQKRLDQAQSEPRPLTLFRETYWNRKTCPRKAWLDRWCLREKLLGRTYRQMAEQLGYPHAETARLRVCRAMQELRQSQPEVYQHLRPRIWRNER